MVVGVPQALGQLIILASGFSVRGLDQSTSVVAFWFGNLAQTISPSCRFWSAEFYAKVAWFSENQAITGRKCRWRRCWRDAYWKPHMWRIFAFVGRKRRKRVVFLLVPLVSWRYSGRFEKASPIDKKRFSRTASNMQWRITRYFAANDWTENTKTRKIGPSKSQFLDTWHGVCRGLTLSPFTLYQHWEVGSLARFFLSLYLTWAAKFYPS